MELTPDYITLKIKRDKHEFGHYFALAKERNVCSYCGEYASDDEHVIPKCTGWPTYTVRACRECNLLAGSFLAFSFQEKRSYIKKLYWKISQRLNLPNTVQD